jgi:hypothetical protein
MNMNRLLQKIKNYLHFAMMIYASFILQIVSFLYRTCSTVYTYILDFVYNQINMEIDVNDISVSEAKYDDTEIELFSIVDLLDESVEHLSSLYHAFIELIMDTNLLIYLLYIFACLFYMFSCLFYMYEFARSYEKLFYNVTQIDESEFIVEL